MPSPECMSTHPRMGLGRAAATRSAGAQKQSKSSGASGTTAAAGLPRGARLAPAKLLGAEVGAEPRCWTSAPPRCARDNDGNLHECSRRGARVRTHHLSTVGVPTTRCCGRRCWSSRRLRLPHQHSRRKATATGTGVAGEVYECTRIACQRGSVNKCIKALAAT
jgi:hypothetical protein